MSTTTGDMDISMNKESNDMDTSTRAKRKTLKVPQPSNEHDGIEMSGYLQKRRGGFGRHMPNAWQIRYFTLKDGIMYYYEDSGSDAKPRGKVDLRSENCDFMNGLVFEGAPTPYTMQIIPGGWDEKWKLCASTKEDMELWVAAIMKHITDEAKRKPAQLNIKSYVSDDDECDDAEAEEDDGPHLKIRGVPVSGGNSIVTSSTPTTPRAQSAGQSSQPDNRAPAATSANPSTATTTATPATTTPATTVTPAKSNPPKPETTLSPPSDTASGSGSVNKHGSSKSKRRLKLQSDASARTLQLRSTRLVQQQHALTTAHTAALKAMQESHHQAIQAMIQKSSESSTGTPVALLALDALVSGKEEPDSAASKPSGPPPPGTTVPQVINGVPPDVPTHSWNICDPSTFNVRVGPDYAKYKRKGPSAKALYEPYAVDTFCAKNRIDHVAQFIKLENTDHIDTHNEFVPPLLVIQIQLPSDAPPLFETIEDGPGWAIVMYFRITKETCEELKDLSTASPAVKLFAKYCQFAEKDPAWRGRFKVINYCSNLEEMGVPNVIMSYNAKPVLIRRTGSVFRGTGSSKYLEIDIHVHKFANLAKKSIHALSSRCSLMYMQIGFVIEGRTDEELPETLFACVGVNRPEEDKAEFLFDPPDEES